MKILLATAAIAALLITAASAMKGDRYLQSFEEQWKDRVETPLALPQPICEVSMFDLRPLFWQCAQPTSSNQQAGNFDVRFTGYGFPWIEIKSMKPASCDVWSVEPFAACSKD